MKQHLITKLQLITVIILAVCGKTWAQNNGEYMDVFSIDRVETYNDMLRDNSVILHLQADKEMISAIAGGGFSNIRLKIPIAKNRFLTMKLHRFDVFSGDFILRTSRGDTIVNYKKAIFYRGKIKGEKGVAIFSFSDSGLQGIISLKNGGNFNIAKMQNSDKYILYNDKDMMERPKFYCGVLDDEDNEENAVRRRGKNHVSNRDISIKMYLEADYALYQEKGSVLATADYVSSLFAQVKSLYLDEGLKLEIKEMKIWVSQDNYSTTNSTDALMTFRTNNLDVDADLCHLFALGGNNLGGTAWVDVLCNDNFHFGYSNICSYFNQLPMYSWSVECVTHEIGHNIGVWHTHDCVWNGDNSQIDDCGNEYKAQKGDPTPACYDSSDPVLPVSGTIMSYCHLLNDIGIDFNNGFDDQVADSLLVHYNNAQCLTESGDDLCEIPVNVKTDSVFSTSALLGWEHGSGSNMWQIQYGPQGFELGTGTILSNITQSPYEIVDLSVGDLFDWYIRSDCGNGEYSAWVGPKTFKTKCITPQPLELPFFEGWEEDSGYLLASGPMSCSEYHTWEFVTDHDNDDARARWGMYCPSYFVMTDSGALVMDRKSFGENTINYAILTLNMVNYISAQNVYLRFSYMDIGDENHENDKVWVRGSDTSEWLVVYDLDPENKVNGEIHTIKIDLDSLLRTGNQSFSTSFQLRLGQEDNYPTMSDGMAFDDIKIFDCSDADEAGFPGNPCWSAEDTNGDGITWAFNQESPCDQNAYGLIKENSDSKGSYSLDDWLFSSAYYLEAGQSYVLDFAVADQGENEKLEVFLSMQNNSNEASNNGLLLFKDEGLNNEDCLTSSIEFVPQVSAEYYIAFHGFSNSYTPHHLFIDDFHVEATTGLSGYSIEDNIDNSCEMVKINGVAGNAWHNFYKDGKIIASINPNGQELGQVYVQFRDGGDVEVYNIDNVDVKTIPRYFNFGSAVDFSNTVSLRLFFLEDELNEYNNTVPYTADNVSHLQVNHYDGNNENCLFGDNDNAGTNIDASYITTGVAGSSGYYIQVEVNSFSEFLIHQNTANTMPVPMILKVTSHADENKLSLTVANETGIEKYVFQKKYAFSSWTDIEKVDADKENNGLYTVFDNDDNPELYYRVVAVDYDGLEHYSAVVNVQKDADGFALKRLYPNPGEGHFIVQLQLQQLSPVQIEVADVYGNIVYQHVVDRVSKSFIYHIDLQDAANGIYFLSLTQEDKRLVRKLLIEK